MLKHFIKAARLRTLPLSISGIIVGTFIAYSKEYFDLKILITALLTTIGFQVLSNFANDYGDGVKGTDNKDRVGPKRALQSGVISPKQMLKAIIITGITTFIIALFLIYFAFGRNNFLYSVVFITLGIVCIIAAIKYTMGKNAYGYSGLGDVFVFLFFGLVATIGTYFLYTQQLNYHIILPAITIGCLSTAVLNLNNMRDFKNDKNSNKNTLVVKIGLNKALNYHKALLIISFISIAFYTYLNFNSIKQGVFLFAYIPIIKHYIFISDKNNSTKLDNELKKVALSTFLFAILFGIGLIF